MQLILIPLLTVSRLSYSSRLKTATVVQYSCPVRMCKSARIDGTIFDVLHSCYIRQIERVETIAKRLEIFGSHF